MERTCVIIKPDGLGKRVVGKIIERFESEGLKLLAMKMIKPKRTELEEFYGTHRGKDYFEPFMDFITSMPIIVTVWEGENAIKNVRRIIGSTDSRKAEQDTLRKLFGTNERRNLVHASDSVENAKKEIAHFFKNNEIFEYSENAWKP